MRAGRRGGWLEAHAIDAVFAAIALFWLWYLWHLSKDQSYWSDDLRVVQQASDWGGLLKPYNGALSLVSMIVDRAAISVGHFAYWPFTLAGVLALLSVPVAYFVTTRRSLGPALAGVLAMSLLWYDSMDPRPVALNHFLVLTMAILCAAALNRGRRADWVIAVALVIALAAGGGGLVIVLACLVHCAITRPPWRRWVVIVAPLALYLVWYAINRPQTKGIGGLSTTDKAKLVRDFLTVAFYQVGFGLWPFALLLGVAFLAWGAYRLRDGLRAGANFVAWTVALVAWPIALVQSRGGIATASTYRYGLVALGFALLAVVPDRPIKWPPLANPDRRWLAAGVAVLLLFAGLRANQARPALDAYSKVNADRGRKVEATLRVARLQPQVVPPSTPLPFFSITNPHGTAGQLRALLNRWSAPFHPTKATIDQDLIDQNAVSARTVHRGAAPASCDALTAPLTLTPTSFGERALGAPPPKGPTTDGPAEYDFYSKNGSKVEIKRFGSKFVHVVDIPPDRDVMLTLPLLSSAVPYQVRADGACLRK